MSSKDKTRQKLVSSMRKTKSGSSKSEADTDVIDNAQARPAQKKAKKPAKKVVIKHKAVSTADLFQSGRRVWPD